jgi:hypothetical protein
LHFLQILGEPRRFHEKSPCPNNLNISLYKFLKSCQILKSIYNFKKEKSFDFSPPSSTVRHVKLSTHLGPSSVSPSSSRCCHPPPLLHRLPLLGHLPRHGEAPPAPVPFHPPTGCYPLLSPNAKRPFNGHSLSAMRPPADRLPSLAVGPYKGPRAPPYFPTPPSALSFYPPLL